MTIWHGYRQLIRPLLFQLPPETAHHLVLQSLDILPAWCLKTPKLGHPVEAMGLHFPNPLGIAAGLDKNAEYLSGLAKLGLGFIEVGTVTPKPQPGNPRPRLFRLPGGRALINRMGFNNHGVHALVDRLNSTSYRGILGVNIGKNKDTSLNAAAEDYEYCMAHVYPLASYITINISSPNTPDLRQLQQGDYFFNLISRLTHQQKLLADYHQKLVPLVVKISPDESTDSLKKIAAVLLEQGVAGIIATNTTASRDQVKGLMHAEEMGGLSGAPLRDRALSCLHLLKQEVGDTITLIGSGGIDSASAIQERLEAGADLVQVYTGLIYEGFALFRP